MDGHPWLHEQVLTTLTSWWVSFPDHSVVTWQHFCVLRILLLYVHSHMCHFQWFSSRLSMKILNLCGSKNTIQNSLNFAHWIVLQMPLRCVLDLEIHNSHTKKGISHIHEDSLSENFRLKTTKHSMSLFWSNRPNYALLCSLLILCVCWVIKNDS